MLDSALDIPAARDRLADAGRVQVHDYLQASAAEQLQRCLQHEVRWTLALRDDSGARTIDHDAYAGMPRDALRRLLADTAESGSGDAYRFAYDSYMMVTAYKQGRDPDLLLHRVLELFNSPQYLAFAREITGDPGIRRINAQATRYRPGHFLRYHTDVDTREGRRYAYVLNLTHGWRPDWGGLLQFIQGDTVTETFLPRWNSLSLFKVPAGHAVSLVAPWAGADRLAITGWFLS